MGKVGCTFPSYFFPHECFNANLMRQSYSLIFFIFFWDDDWESGGDTRTAV